MCLCTFVHQATPVPPTSSPRQPSEAVGQLHRWTFSLHRQAAQTHQHAPLTLLLRSVDRKCKTLCCCTVTPTLTPHRATVPPQHRRKRSRSASSAGSGDSGSDEDDNSSSNSNSDSDEGGDVPLFAASTSLRRRGGGAAKSTTAGEAAKLAQLRWALHTSCEAFSVHSLSHV